jgi:CRISPR/Cas system-associated protein Cas10 (large subunit of type III CRISPR-Cas system)
MKKTILILIVLIASITYFNQSSKADTCGGKCSGGANCNACKNCSGCKHCAKEGGICSVCKDYSEPKPAVKPKPKNTTVVKKKTK